MVMRNAECPLGGFVIGNAVFTTQYHPEITHEFMSALIEEYDGKLPGDVARTARASLSQPAENAVFARWIIDFFRQAG